MDLSPGLHASQSFQGNMRRQQLTLRSEKSSGDSRHVVPVAHRTRLPIQGIRIPDPAHTYIISALR